MNNEKYISKLEEKISELEYKIARIESEIIYSTDGIKVEELNARCEYQNAKLKKLKLALVEFYNKSEDEYYK